MEDRYAEFITEYEELKKEYNSVVVDKFDKVDFTKYIASLFTAHSCGIEGNSFTVDETYALKEKGLELKLFGKSTFEAFEILDHFKAYEYAMANLDKNLDEDFVKKLHSILAKNTIEYRTGTKAGIYTTMDMIAGDTMFGDHEKNIKAMPNLLKSTQDTIDSKKIHPIVVSAMFHKFFIYLHPFRDGNGRLGRLLSNFILAKTDNPIIVIDAERKQEYIQSLKASHKRRDMLPIVSFFFKTSMDRMKKEISDKKNISENFQLKFDDFAKK